MTWRQVAGAVFLVAAAAAAIGWYGPASQPVVTASQPASAPIEHPVQLGKPRADLTQEELAAFYAGQELFVQVRSEVGPYYVATSCLSCHFDPTIGGAGGPDDGGFIGPHADGKDVEGYATRALPGWTLPDPPANVTRRKPPPLFGLGLVERIPDATIRAACGTGHFGDTKRLGSLPPNDVARFGYKPYLGTVPDFLGDVLRGALSLTNELDNSPDEDAFPDPEVDRKYIETLSAFVRGLAPPGRNGTDAAGEAAFRSFGCATCHVPDMPPANDVFSDFCLHSMGEELADGITDHTARGDEFRTAPLWGLRFRTTYLHDGRARTLEGAIDAHGGEALSAARAYRNAPEDQRAALLRFLQTL